MKFVTYYIAVVILIIASVTLGCVAKGHAATKVTEPSCKTTTEAFIVQNPLFTLKKRISAISDNKDEVAMFKRIYDAIVGSIGKPPYAVDEFLYFEGTAPDNSQVTTMSVEGNGCHRTYFVLSIKPGKEKTDGQDI